MNLKFRVLLPAIITVLSCLSCSKPVTSFEYGSRFYKIKLVDSLPFVKYFSVDALGQNNLENNPIQWNAPLISGEFELRKISDSKVKIVRKGDSDKSQWLMKFTEREFTFTSRFTNDSIKADITFRFDKNKNHATLLGLMTEKRKTNLPALVHLPDMGTLKLEADQPDVIVDYDARRYQGKGYISVKLPEATDKQSTVSYRFKITSIYPHFDAVEQDRYAGFRRNFISLYQVNPVFQTLANNSCSDPVAFTLFMSSMLAAETPQLTESLTAFDLIRMSVERYFNGMKSYGLVGYGDDIEGTEVAGWHSPYASLDSYPSMVIAACNYIESTKDIQWAQKYYPRIKEWMDMQMKRDYNGNGLAEYELSGNSGSWDGYLRPSNWWDTIGFGHEDAFSNTLTYEALNLIARISEMLGEKNQADLYRGLAAKMKDVFYQTFYNPETGVLAGWKSRDGKLHDYYFLMVNSMAVYYDLVPEDKAKDVMMALWKKMQEVGFTDFTLGVPGNLISIRKEDYTHPDPRWGGGQLEDGSDAFQRYENGGASLNWSYFTLKAFQKTGLEEQYNVIADGILEGINAGSFQGSCTEGGMTKDWKSWSGECWGYEGFLCDGYLVILALMPENI
ncbi:MAG: hypothetical protein RBR81_13615 [Bacteroidales bacterium]|jgi:hypothetical protein|nr:hypothetical protein [Bacteroidales bacterium]